MEARTLTCWKTPILSLTQERFAFLESVGATAHLFARSAQPSAIETTASVLRLLAPKGAPAPENGNACLDCGQAHPDRFTQAHPVTLTVIPTPGPIVHAFFLHRALADWLEPHVRKLGALPMRLGRVDDGHFRATVKHAGEGEFADGKERVLAFASAADAASGDLDLRPALHDASFVAQTIALLQATRTDGYALEDDCPACEILPGCWLHCGNVGTEGPDSQRTFLVIDLERYRPVADLPTRALDAQGRFLAVGLPKRSEPHSNWQTEARWHNFGSRRLSEFVNRAIRRASDGGELEIGRIVRFPWERFATHP